MSDERLQRAVELTEWVREHREVGQAVTKVLTGRGFVSIGHLAHEAPEVFDELHEAMRSMLEELPWA